MRLKVFVITLDFSEQPKIDLEPKLLSTTCLLANIEVIIFNLPFLPRKPWLNVMVVRFLIAIFLDFLEKNKNGKIVIMHESNWRLTSVVTNKKVEQVALYFGSTCCPTALCMLNMKKMMRAEIICPHGPRDSQANGQRDRERKKFGKILFLKIPFINSLYLWTGTLCYHHTKMKLKFKKMNRYAVGPKIELKLICHKKTLSLENMDTSLLSAYCATSSCHVRFKVKEYKQIRYVFWAATGYGQMVKGTKQRKCETYGIFKSFFNLGVLLLYSKFLV